MRVLLVICLILAVAWVSFVWAPMVPAQVVFVGAFVGAFVTFLWVVHSRP